MNIIGLSGYAQSGKDTAGRHFMARDHSTRYAFADPIRRIMEDLDCRVDGSISVAMLLDSLDGDWEAAEHHRVYGAELRRITERMNLIVNQRTFNDFSRSPEQIREDAYVLDPFLDGHETMMSVLGRLGSWESAKTDRIHGPEIRRFMQCLGTEVVRGTYGDKAWVDVTAKLVGAAGSQDVVVTDVRFDEEAQWIRSQGGAILEIRRPGVGPVNTHISESCLNPELIDAVIHNDADLQTLALRLDAAVPGTPVIARAA